MTKKAFVILLKVLGGTVLAAVMLLVAALFALNTEGMQNRLKDYALEQLRMKLRTEISLDKVSVHLFGQTLLLQGLQVDDLQHRPMLRLRELGVNMDVWRLLEREVRVTDASVKGLEASLFKASPDTAANFQFVIDAFKREKTDSVVTDSVKTKRKPMRVALSRVYLEDIRVNYNGHASHLGSMLFRQSKQGNRMVEAREVTTNFVTKSKKGAVDNRLRIGLLNVQDVNHRLKVTVDSLCFVTDNHKPRANTGKPKHGYFDAGHLDVVAQLRLDIDSISKDTLSAVLSECRAVDRGSSLVVSKLGCRVKASKRGVLLNDVTVALPNTTLRFAEGEVLLPDKKLGRRMAYKTSAITGSVQLRDISRTFAPVLAGFKQPLTLSVVMSGDDDSMRFRDAWVSTSDKKLNIKTDGRIMGLKNKYKLHVHFDVHQANILRGEAERIINQFTVKKFMMKQLSSLGHMSYTGHFDVKWHREEFFGKLRTECGDLDFQFALDEDNKYVFGTARTESLELGKAMDMPNLGRIVCKADFKFDISKPRTARMRRLKGGKLPIGTVDAEVKEVKWKFVKVINVTGNIVSDGAVANGNVKVGGKRMDVLCAFSFTNTNDMRNIKIKPGVKFHKMTDEDKARRDEKRIQKQQEKEARRQAKAEQKALENEEKAERDARKAEEKAARKAQRAAEKALRKAEREAKRAVKRSAKEPTVGDGL